MSGYYHEDESRQRDNHLGLNLQVQDHFESGRRSSLTTGSETSTDQGSEISFSTNQNHDNQDKSMFSTNQIQEDQEDSSSFSTNQNLPDLQSPFNQISALNHLAHSHPGDIGVTEKNVRNHFSTGGEIDQVCLAARNYEQGMKRFLILEHFRTCQQWMERKAASSNSWCLMIIKETKEEEGNLLEIIPPTPV